MAVDEHAFSIVEIRRDVLRLLEITTKNSVYPSVGYSANHFHIVARSRIALWVHICDMASELMNPKINTSMYSMLEIDFVHLKIQFFFLKTRCFRPVFFD